MLVSFDAIFIRYKITEVSSLHYIPSGQMIKNDVILTSVRCGVDMMSFWHQIPTGISDATFSNLLGAIKMTVMFLPRECTRKNFP